MTASEQYKASAERMNNAMREYLSNKEIEMEHKMLAICPAMGRPKRLEEAIKSFKKKTSRNTKMICVLEEEDNFLDEYKDLLSKHEIEYFIFRSNGIIKAVNEAFKRNSEYQFYHVMNDDFIYRSKNWDITLIQNIEAKFNGTGIAYCDDGFQHDRIPVNHVLSGNICRCLGSIYPEELSHLYGDNYMLFIGMNLQRIVYCGNAKIEHKHFTSSDVENDDVYKSTNSQERWKRDKEAFDLWIQNKGRDVLNKISSSIHNSDKPKIALCMIIGDYEDPKTIKRCLDSVKGVISEISIVVNYKIRKNVKKFNSITSVLPIGIHCHAEYTKWTNFSDMRNLSIKYATSDWIMWLDCDDVFDNPWMIFDRMLEHPEADYFKCRIHSYTEKGTKELILHNRIFKNFQGYEFRNDVHEDISFSMKEKDAKCVSVDLIINHLGYHSWEEIVKKNRRNMAYSLKEIEKDTAHNLTYFALTNCYMIEAREKMRQAGMFIKHLGFRPVFNELFGWRNWYIKAIKTIDECLEKFPMTWDDPLLSKMWILRGICCRTCNQNEAAEQSFRNAYVNTNSPESAVNLAEILILKDKWLEVVNILSPFLEMESIEITNTAIDVDEIRKLILRKLGIACSNLGKEHVNMAVRCFEEYISIDKNDIYIADLLARSYMKAGNSSACAKLNVALVNRWPDYANGWSNLAAFEMLGKRWVTAKLFLERALKADKNHPEAKVNLEQIKKAGLA